jgi:hypothetical protein
MSAISATGSSASYSAIAQLLADDLSNTATAGAGPQIGQASSAGSSASTSRAPTDSVDLSDHAKAVLAQAQRDQVAASELQALVQSNRNSGGAAASGITQTFNQLTGQAQSQQGTSANLSLAQLAQSDGLLDGEAAYIQELNAAHRQPDGTYTSWSQTLHDVFVTAPSTPQEVASWYQSTEGQQTLSAAQAWPQDDPGLAEALASHSVTFLNASDIPDLNLHNTISIQGGEGGSGGSAPYTYNHDAAIFSDPATSYKVLGDGIVLAWKTPPAAQTLAPN